MAIDKKYLDILDQIEKRQDEVTQWEREFALGVEGDKKKTPLNTRPYLSIKQKEILDRIVVERFEGGKWDNKKVRTDYGDIGAEKTNEGWVLTIKTYPVGMGVTKKEIIVVTAWLDSALRTILALPEGALSGYEGAVVEVDDNVALGDGPEGNSSSETMDEEDPF